MSPAPPRGSGTAFGGAPKPEMGSLGERAALLCACPFCSSFFNMLNIRTDCLCHIHYRTLANRCGVRSGLNATFLAQLNRFAAVGRLCKSLLRELYTPLGWIRL